MEHLDLIGLFIIALIGGFGHCIGMCGGIVLAYSSKLTNNAKDNQKWLILSHILYSLGRITTYAMLGGIVGALGSALNLNATLRSALFFFAGAAMILAGLSLLGKINFLTRIEHSLQNSKWYQTTFQKALNLKNPLSLYLLGLLNGLLPCGFVYAFLFSAAGFASITQGVLVMLVFGAGTLPSLLLFGLLANTIFYQKKFRKILINIAAIAIIIFGGLMLKMGVDTFKNPTMQHQQHAHSATTQQQNYHKHTPQALKPKTDSTPHTH